MRSNRLVISTVEGLQTWAPGTAPCTQCAAVMPKTSDGEVINRKNPPKLPALRVLPAIH